MATKQNDHKFALSGNWRYFNIWIQYIYIYTHVWFLYIQNAHVNVWFMHVNMYVCTVSVCPYACMSVCMYYYFPAYLYACLSVRRLSVRLSVRPSVCPCLSVRLHVCMHATCRLDAYMDLAHHSYPLHFLPACSTTKEWTNNAVEWKNMKTQHKQKLPPPTWTSKTNHILLETNLPNPKRPMIPSGTRLHNYWK